jgi:hypothetical protein
MLEEVSALLREYAAWLTIDLSFQGLLRSWPACPATTLRLTGRCSWASLAVPWPAASRCVAWKPEAAR